MRILLVEDDKRQAEFIRRGLEQEGACIDHAIDSLLAATALHHELRIVTRNSKDFDYAGLEVINPWIL